MNPNELSKEISYALRHAPEKFGLKLDAFGWVEIDALITALRHQERFRDLTEENIAEMIQMSEKKRHEMHDGKIRALYGHSIEGKIKKVPQCPPEILYHGTARSFVENIMRTGLTPGKRQYVHLSENTETAFYVGRRKDPKPVIFQVDSKRAWHDGYLFYLGNEKVWLADYIPTEYLSIYNAN